MFSFIIKSSHGSSQSYSLLWPFTTQWIIQGMQEQLRDFYQRMTCSVTVDGQTQPAKTQVNAEAAFRDYQRWFLCSHLQRKSLWTPKAEAYFQRYQVWREALSQALNALYSDLKETPMPPQALQQALLRGQRKFSEQILSPAEYDRQIRKLEKKVIKELKLPTNYRDVFREARARLKEQLQQQPQIALQYFCNDIYNGIQELSHHQTTLKQLYQCLTYYQTLVPDNYYQSVKLRFEKFAQQQTLLQEPYQSIPQNVYKEFIADIQAYFEPKATEQEAPETATPSENIFSLTLNQAMQTAQNALTKGWGYARRHPHEVLGTLIITLTSSAVMYWSDAKIPTQETLNQMAVGFGTGPVYTVLSPVIAGYGLGYDMPGNIVVGGCLASLLSLFPSTEAQAFRASYELSDLMNGVNGFLLNGVNSSDSSGRSVSMAGDFNGDNLTDIIIGAPGRRSNTGASYIVFGSHNAFPASFDLASLNGSNGFVLYGVSTGDESGYSVSMAGDFNGDNLTDIIIGALGRRSTTGASYIVFGSRNAYPASFNLTSLNGTNGFVLNGEHTGDQSGWSVSTAGDFNGDGLSDVIIGNFDRDFAVDGRKGYVVFGSRNIFPASFDLATLNGTNGFALYHPITPESGVGYHSVSTAGDFNGDGLSDVILASCRVYPPYNGTSSYVVFGSRNIFPASFDLATLNGTNGFALNGLPISGTSLCSSSTIGDFNGDGLSDVIIGDPDPAGSQVGVSYIVFGSRNIFPGGFDLASLNGINGFALNSGTHLGLGYYSVSTAGDFNGDGLSDVIIGPTLSSGSFVVFGSRNAFPASFDLASLNGTNGFVLNIPGIFDSVSTAGDFNNDGFSDVIVGRGGEGQGQGVSYVVFGGNAFFATTGLSTTSATTDSSTTVAATSSSTSVAATGSSTDAAAMKVNDDNTTIFIGVGTAVGVLTLAIGVGVVAYLVFKKHQRSELQLRQTNIIEMDEGPGDPTLSPEREEKKHTVIGKKYALVNKINPEEANALLSQTGLEVSFKPGKKTSRLVLGTGNFGKLRVARNIQTNEFVGVKKIKGAKEIQASQDEAAIQRQLNGKPNVMRLLDSVETKGSKGQPVLYQFMPLAGFGNGQELRKQLLTLTTDPALKEALLIHTAFGLLTGINEMHHLHIYHLDVKPANMVIDNQGTAYVIDFGCAVKKGNGIISVIESNGDSSYMSPERLDRYRLAQQVIGQKQDLNLLPIFNGSHADAWAIGVTLLELATGAYPLERATLIQKLQHWKSQYFEDKLSPIAELQNPAADSLMAVIKGLLAVDPKERLTVEEALAMPVFQRNDLFKPYGGAQQALTLLKSLVRTHTEESVSQDEEEDKRNYLKTPQSVKNESSEEKHSERESESEKEIPSGKQVSTAGENDYGILPNTSLHPTFFGSKTRKSSHSSSESSASEKPTVNKLKQEEDTEEEKESTYQYLPR